MAKTGVKCETTSDDSLYPKTKKQKRQQKSPEEEGDDEDFGKLIGQYNASAKKRKTGGDVDIKNVKQKLLETMGQQTHTRKQGNEEILSGLSNLLETLEADLQVLSENEQKLQHMAAAALKAAQQNTNAAKLNIKTVKSIKTKFQNQCEEQECEEKAATSKMADELEQYVTKLQQKLVNDTKKKQLDNLRKSLFQAMNDI